MTVELKDLTPGTIAVCLNGAMAIITGPNPRSAKYPILYKLKAGTRGYKGSPMDFKAVIGVADLDAFNEADSMSKPLEREVVDCPDFMKPEAMKDVKKGDIIEVKHGRGTREVVYMGFKPNRPKYPIQYKIHTGTQYKGQASAFIRKVRDGEVAA
jgi:hypothetical protein